MMDDHYDCLSCGACCKGHLVLNVTDEDRKREARLSGLPDQLQVVGCACPMLGDGNRCDIYETRPYGCSAMPIGGEACLAAREADAK